MTEEVIEINKEIIPFGIKELTEANLALLKKQSDEMVISDNKSYEVVRDAHIQAKDLISSVKARHKEKKAPILAKGRELDGEKNRLVGLVEPIANILFVKRKIWDDKKAAIKAEKEIAEKARVDGIQDGINSIRMLATGAASMAAAQLHTLLSEVDAMECQEDEYQEYTPHAEQAKRESMAAIQLALDARVKRDAEDAARKAEDDRLAVIREQQAAEAARLKKISDYQDVERAAAEAEQARINAELEARIRAENLKLEITQAHGEAMVEDQQRVLEAVRVKLADERAERKREEQARLDKIEADERARAAAELLAAAISDAHGEAIIENEKFERLAEADSTVEKARQQAMRPDAEKVVQFADELLAIDQPMVVSREAELALDGAIRQLAIIAGHLKDETEMWREL